MKIKLFFFFVVPSIYDCTFETDFCLWTHRSDGALNWTRNQGKTTTHETGPQFDVTTKSGRTRVCNIRSYPPAISLEEGWYIYLETSSTPANESARLQSQPIAGSTTKCFEFWYHMHGQDVNRLDVIVVGSMTADQTVWTRQGPQGNAWRLGKVKLNDITDMYRVCEKTLFQVKDLFEQFF